LSEERGLTALLVLLIAYHLAVPLTVDLQAGRLLVAAFFTMFAGLGVIAVLNRTVLRVAVRITAAAALAAAWCEVAYPGRTTMAASSIVVMALVGFLLAAVVAQVFQDGPVTAHRVRGAIVIYLLIATLFGWLYLVVALLDPGAISFSAEFDARRPLAMRSELSYFSFVTITTVGYGDVTPVSPVARALATFEAVMGQLFIAITLARLVSSQLAGRGESGPPPGATE
jgi:hypothetical protein